MMAGKVLVTGGTGFTGGHLCRRLAESGVAVRAFVRDPAKAAPLARLGIEVVQGDLVDHDSVLRATEGVECVYHIAALYRQEAVPRKAFWDVNVKGTENLLSASARHGVRRFVHCSTVGVHGDVDEPPANEDAPFKPGDPYQESKARAEQIALEYASRGEMEVTVFRPTGIYGPGDLRFAKLFRAISRRRFRMIGTGEVFYHLTYIDDLVDGILLCGTRREAVGRVYILGGSEFVTLNDLVRTIAEILETRLPSLRIPVWPVYAAAIACEFLCKPFRIEPPLYRRRLDFFRKNRAFDISRARAELGFSPRVDLRTGLRRTAEWYRDNGYL
jgi:nucleoside-diphosphate-sugar epimerase